MRKFVFALSIVFIATNYLGAQDWAEGFHIDEVDGQTIYTCEGNFFDSGGFAEHC
ncbi:MAG: hypothetical protein JXR60_11955 [Bacteroidales bacterium]|nr:hypothetical protein [Bacteroidales bacterium]